MRSLICGCLILASVGTGDATEAGACPAGAKDPSCHSSDDEILLQSRARHEDHEEEEEQEQEFIEDHEEDEAADASNDTESAPMGGWPDGPWFNARGLGYIKPCYWSEAPGQWANPAGSSDSTVFPNVDDAKVRCLELGESECRSVTCDDDGCRLSRQAFFTPQSATLANGQPATTCNGQCTSYQPVQWTSYALGGKCITRFVDCDTCYPNLKKAQDECVATAKCTGLSKQNSAPCGCSGQWSLRADKQVVSGSNSRECRNIHSSHMMLRNCLGNYDKLLEETRAAKAAADAAAAAEANVAAEARAAADAPGCTLRRTNQLSDSSSGETSYVPVQWTTYALGGKCLEQPVDCGAACYPNNANGIADARAACIADVRCNGITKQSARRRVCGGCSGQWQLRKGQQPTGNNDGCEWYDNFPSGCSAWN